MLPVGVKLSCLLILRSCGGKRDKLRIFTLFSVLGDSGEVWWSNTWISSIHWVSCPVILRSEEFLTRVTELELCGFRLLIFFQDYSRNFLFLELISLSGGRGYYRYGHVLWLLSLEKKKKNLLNFQRPLNVRVITAPKTELQPQLPSPLWSQ